MRRISILMSALMLIASVAFSQATTYPWTEDFESGSLETNGWTTEIVSGEVNWHVGTSAYSQAHTGNNSVIILNESYSGDTAKLFSPMFTRPEDMDTLRLFFWYINPTWGGDVNIMELYILNGETSTKIYEVTDSHEGWTHAEIELLVAGLPQTFQLCFVGIPKYGFDFQIDDITLGGDAYVTSDDDQVDEVTIYPWSDDFESGDFQTKGWTTQIVNGSVTWQISNDAHSEAYSGQYSAVAENSSYDADVTELISTTFVRPTDIDTIKLSYAFINPAWSSDINDMYVYYADAENLNIRTEVYGTNGTANDSWVNNYVIIPVTNLPEKFKIVFKANLAYGYALQLDNVSVSEYVFTTPTIDTLETEEYLQVGTEQLHTDIPTDVDYGYSYCQEIFLAREMGGARTIYSLGFNSYESVETLRRYVSISLGYTEKNRYDSITDWVPVADLHEVYNGNFDIFEEGGWIYAVLDEPFEYNGTDNLVVAFSDTTGGRNYFTVDFFTSTSYYNEMTRHASFAYDSQYDLNNLGQINGGSNNRRNNIRFGLVPMEVPGPVYDTVENERYLQVGTGFTTQLSLPFDTYYNYSYSQQIFEAGELGRPRDIYSVSINYVGGEYGDMPQSTNRNIEVYLGYTDKSGYNGSTDWAETDGFTKVFADFVEISENSCWITFVFDSVFRYVDTANLVVAFIDKTGDYDASRVFACTKSPFDKKVLSGVNDDSEYDITDLTTYGDVGSSRSNIRFGIIPVEMHTITVMANDSTMGVVVGGGRCMPYEGRTISATAYPGFQFDGWNDGAIENPRFLVPTTDTTIIANFSAVRNDTIYYDNDTYGNVVGFHGDHVEWGIRISPARIAARTQLTEVLFYVDGEYAFGQYDLNVYQGVDTIPTVSILHDTIVVDSAAQGWMSFGFEPVAIDTTKPMWVILSNEGTRYPAVASAFVGDGYKDGAWWNSNGTWQQQSYGAWMIRAVMPFADDAVEEMTMESISVYPNPAGDFIYIDGVESGSTVEIYNTLGSMVRNFTYEGGEVDFSGMPAGMYILRSDENVTRFVKE